MPRWLWILAVPWVVAISTPYGIPVYTLSYEGETVELFGCRTNYPNCKPILDDLAESLNQAHERRTKVNIICTDCKVGGFCSSLKDCK